MTIWDEQHETIDRERLGRFSSSACRACWRASTTRVPLYRARLDGGRLPARRPEEPRRPARAALHRPKNDFREQVPVRAVRGAHGRGRRDPLLVGDHGQAGGRRFHPPTSTPGPSWSAASPWPPGCGRRRRPGLVRLRHVHRRLRSALRAAARRRRGAAHQRRQHGPPAPVHAGLRHHRAHRHAVVCALPRRGRSPEAGVPREDLKLRLGLFGAEACGEQMRAQIESSSAHHAPPTTTASPR